jgi:hypothetical protein
MEIRNYTTLHRRDGMLMTNRLLKVDCFEHEKLLGIRLYELVLIVSSSNAYNAQAFSIHVDFHVYYVYMYDKKNLGARSNPWAFS